MPRPDSLEYQGLAQAPEPAFDGLDEVAQEPLQPAVHDHGQVSTRFAPRTGIWLAITAGLCALVLAIAFFVVNHVRVRDSSLLEAATTFRARQAPQVETVQVEYAPATQTLTLPGETRGWYSSTIYARVSGYLAKWSVDIGDHVKKDQILATIDTPDLDAQLDAAEAQLKAAEADVEVKDADASFAKTTYERWQGSPKGIVSEQEREDKKAHYQAAVAQLNAARARVNLAAADVKRLMYLTRFRQVTAPFDGVITERRTDIGDLVTAGSTANTTPLFGIAQYKQIRVFADVPQRASTDLKVGNPAQVITSEHPDRVFAGRISRTSESLDPHARTLRVEVDLANDELALVPGMYVQVQFHLNPTRFVQVPATAMVFRANGPQVALVDSAGTVKFQDVSIARDNGKFVEIASGLSAGDRVAVNISNQIASGERVTVIDGEKGSSVATK